MRKTQFKPRNINSNVPFVKNFQTKKFGNWSKSKFVGTSPKYLAKNTLDSYIEAWIHRAEIILDLSKIWGAIDKKRASDKIYFSIFLYLIPNYNWRGHLSVDQNSSQLTFKTAESEISSPNLGLSADLDRWDYYFFSSKRSLCLGPKNEMMLLSWHFWCACWPSRFYLARLSFAKRMLEISDSFDLRSVFGII